MVWVPAFVFGPGRLAGWNWCRQGHGLGQGAPRVMELKLHANATTTPKTRAYIQRSQASVAGACRRTWGEREHHPPLARAHLARRSLAYAQAPGGSASRGWKRRARCEAAHPAAPAARRHHRESCGVASTVPSRAAPSIAACNATASAAGQSPTSCWSASSSRPRLGFIHIDLKHLPALERQKSYAFVAIDRATRYVYLYIYPVWRCRDRRRLPQALPRPLPPSRPPTPSCTDNGSEFTDRFAVDMKKKPARQAVLLDLSMSSAGNTASPIA